MIGTSHLRCNSAREVTSLIGTVRPDGVVLELDPERVLRLTKQSQGFDENGVGGGRRTADDVVYGADFVAAVDACQEWDVPLFLGDECVQETRRRIFERALDWRAYSPAPMAKSALASVAGDEDERTVRIDIPGAFAKDPRKLVPLVATGSPPFLLASAFALFGDGAFAYDGPAISNAVETIASIVASYLASSLLFNTVIAERDEILAANTLRAAKVLRSLKDGASIRKRWRFAVNQDEKTPHATGANGESDSLPLFTLKTPLKRAAMRNLNLFEPRWLKMIDRITKEKDASEADIFGCVRCTNKFYSAISMEGVEGRYADVIFERVGTFAKIKELKEGRRPVSGDRKVNVVIEGGDSFVVDESNLSMSDDGYMVATDKLPVDVVDFDRDMSSRGESKDVIRMVVVVGLLHGNGVIDLLSKS